MNKVISSERCYLRRLGVNDDLRNYLYWMQTPSNNPFILSASLSYNLTELKNFIYICNNRTDIILLGIFTNNDNVHIGNIKFDDINLLNKSATLGILIGDKKYRGKGVAREVIMASVSWLQDSYDIKTIRLGVNPDNLSALNLYLKLGFMIIEETKMGGYVMEAKINELSGI
jgi:ribosomal-protein-alanine N-acetyltransferase